MAIQRKTKLVAIVDDDDLMRSALQGMLKSVALPSQAFASAEEFLKSGQQNQTACLIADIRMPDMSGIELVDIATQRQRDLKIILISGYFVSQQVQRRFLRKPFRMRDLAAAVKAELAA